MRLLIVLFALLVLSGFAPAEPEGFEFTWHIIVALIAGIYEVVARIIPTVKNYAVIHKAIEILIYISNFLNRKRK